MTTLIEDYTRAQDTEFRLRVRSSLMRILPDVIGETVALATSPGGTGTEAKRKKRHQWAMDVLSRPDHWVERASMLLAGETQIQAVAIGTMPGDTLIDARVKRLIDDMAGCEITDTP